MRIALIADAFPPLRSSCAVQLRDLSFEFVKQGHQVTVIIPAPEQECAWKLESWKGVQIGRLKAPKSKDVSYIRRTLAEFLMPYSMLRNLRKSPLAKERWDAIVWYSPTIFLGPLAKKLKRANLCRSYLIIRDIFPEWALDMGLMSRGLPYRFFKAVAEYQYKIADVIGIQTQGNAVFFSHWLKKSGRRLEVLQNWIADTPISDCSINIQETTLRNRIIFVYAGNMGIAQGMDVLLNLAEFLKDRRDIGFLFVGRGSESARLEKKAQSHGLDNVLFLDEIDPDEIPGLYEQCNIGLIALDPKHKTHNIPGKFLTYMQSGLPVLAIINPGNDLIDLIEEERVGSVCTDANIETVGSLALQLIEGSKNQSDIEEHCKALAAKLFSPEVAVRQIVEALQE